MINSLILVGNPNVGKTTIFNGITGKNEKVGNWHGVTVGEKISPLKQNKQVSVIDLPGLYSFSCFSMEEKVAKQSILKADNSLIVNIIDINYLERSLELTKELILLKRPMVIVLNFYAEFIKNGGRVDINKLSQNLNIPIFVLEKINKNSFKNLQQNFLQIENNVPQDNNFQVEQFYQKANIKDNLITRLLLKSWTSVLFFFLFMVLVFYLAFGNNMFGEKLKQLIENFFAESVNNLIRKFLESNGSSIVFQNFVCEAFVVGAGSLLAFVPQIAILYFALILAEESGVMSYIAFSLDGILSKIALSGRAVFSLLMGFGCTAAAIMTTGGLENKQLQKRTISILPYLSCSAKLPVFLTMASAFFVNKFLVVVALYLFGIILGLISSILYSKQANESEFIMELTRIKLPSIRQIAKPLLFYIKQYIIKISTIVLSFLLVVWFFLNFDNSFVYTQGETECSMLANFSQVFKYLFYPMGIKDWRVALSAFSGIISKESVAGTLSMFYGENIQSAMSSRSAIAFCVFMLACTPCINAVVVSIKEIGFKTSLFNATLQTVVAFFISYIVYFLSGINIGYLSVSIGVIVFALIIYIYKKE